MILLAAAVLTASCRPLRGWREKESRESPAPEENSLADHPSVPRHPWVSPQAAERARLLVRNMSLEEKTAQVMMVSYGLGPELPPEFSDLLEETPVGAVLLLGYNFAEEPQGVADLTGQITALSGAAGAGIPAFIAVDHEGGTVYRLGRAGTRLPGASAVGAALEAGMDPHLPEALYRNGAEQLALLGISVNLAPVLEPLNDENRNFLSLRAFSADPRTVAAAGGIFIRAMRDGGVLAVGKHFPGSGDGDPHESLPLFAFDLGDPEELQSLHPQIRAFGEAISLGELAAVMSSHVRAPGLDPLWPVSLSSRAQEDFLRSRLGFQGLIMTDDINMKALSGNGDPAGTAAQALAAGADIIMYLEKDIPEVHRALVQLVRDGGTGGEEIVSRGRLDQAVQRILEMKIALGLLDGGDDGKTSAEDAARGRKTLWESPPPGGYSPKSFSPAAFGELKKEGDRLLREFRAFRPPEPAPLPASAEKERAKTP